MTGLLWLTQETPDAQRGGGALRQAGLLTELARHVPIDLIVAGEPPAAGVAAAMRDVELLPGQAPPSRGQRARGLLALADPWFVPEVDGARRVRRAIEGALTRGNRSPSVTVVTHLPLAPLLPIVPGHGVFHPFHVVADQLRGEAAQSSGLRALRLRRYAANAARLERRAVEASSTTLAVCRDDAEQLAVPGQSIVVAPNAVDVATGDRLGDRPPDPVVLFPASLAYAPNADGALWLGRQVWPLIRQAVATARLLIVGRAPGPEVRALAGLDGIEVHADVPDIAPWFQQARVVVVPLRFGTGTRIKALEAMAARRPVVGTTVGLAGLDLVDGLHAHVVDDEAGFAERVVDALGKGGDALVGPARALVETRHTWPVVGATVLEALEALTGGDL